MCGVRHLGWMLGKPPSQSIYVSIPMLTPHPNTLYRSIHRRPVERGDGAPISIPAAALPAGVGCRTRRRSINGSSNGRGRSSPPEAAAAAAAPAITPRPAATTPTIPLPLPTSTAPAGRRGGKSSPSRLSHRACQGPLRQLGPAGNEHTGAAEPDGGHHRGWAAQGLGAGGDWRAGGGVQ